MFYKSLMVIDLGGHEQMVGSIEELVTHYVLLLVNRKKNVNEKRINTLMNDMLRQRDVFVRSIL